MVTLEALKLDFNVADPQTCRNLTIYPLVGTGNGYPNYLTLDEALSQGTLEIKEVGSGRVPELLVVNRGERDVLIIGGEELLGAKQNRTVNVSIIVAAMNSLKIPVSCTEKGRWHEGKEGMRMKHVSSHYSSSRLRQVLAHSVSDSLQTEGSYHSDQASIWDTIDCTISDFGIASPTRSQSDIFEERRLDIEDYLDHFHLLSDQAGMVGLVNGKIASLDLFGKADTFSRMFKKLLRSYAVDAISKQNKISQTNGQVSGFLNDLKTARIERYEAPGKGEHLSIQGKKQKGMALMVGDHLVHLCSFPQARD